MSTTFPKIKDTQLFHIFLLYLASFVQTDASLSGFTKHNYKEFATKSRSVCNVLPKSFCNVIRIVGSNIFLFCWTMFIKYFLKNVV